ncbi:MAG: zf-HC2 domain-containing protein [Bacteroidota bacterium]
MSTSTLMVITFALSIVWYMWRRIKNNLTCLDDEDIDDFLSNRLSEKEQKQVREHLLRCSACKMRFDEMTKQAQKMKPERLLKRRF